MYSQLHAAQCPSTETLDKGLELRGKGEKLGYRHLRRAQYLACGSRPILHRAAKCGLAQGSGAGGKGSQPPAFQMEPILMDKAPIAPFPEDDTALWPCPGSTPKALRRSLGCIYGFCNRNAAYTTVGSLCSSLLEPLFYLNSFVFDLFGKMTEKDLLRIGSLSMCSQPQGWAKTEDSPWVSSVAARNSTCGASTCQLPGHTLA